MNESLVYTLILIGVIVIAILAWFIVKQLRQQREAARQLAEQQEKLAVEAAANRRYLTESIRIISNAILHDDKITLTEGCMRLKVMIDNYDATLHQDPDYQVIEEVYGKTSHIPIRQDWKALDKKSQRKFQMEMFKVEAECQERVRVAAQRLIDHEMHRVH
jgi:type II secretory pathway pseudopilin PulG